LAEADRRNLPRRGLLAFSLFVALGCSSAKSSPPAASAPSNDTAKCDAAAPVSLLEARSVVAKRCASCHSPSGTAGEDYDWTNEQSLVLHRRNVAAQIAEDSMPPAGYPRPTPEERRTLLCWAEGKGN
jgi:uncharacterized membrane protein